MSIYYLLCTVRDLVLLLYLGFGQIHDDDDNGGDDA